MFVFKMVESKNMNQFQSKTAEEIIKDLVAEGKVSTEAVQALDKHLNADWIITADEAEMLFRINKLVGRNDENCETWTELYVNAIARFVVYDLNTPGEVSADEAEWIQKHISRDGEMSPSDIKLLQYIRRHATTICDLMQPLFSAADANLSD